VKVRLLIVSLILAAAAEARADLTKATANFERGTRLYQVGEYAKALEEFKAGYVEEADPSFLYNVGQCYRQLGNPKEALQAYRRFLNLSPDTPLRAEVERKIREAEETLRTQKATEATRPAPAGAVAPAEAPAKWELEERARARRSHWPIWVAGAATVAAAGGAIAMGITTNRRFDDLRSTCGAREVGCTDAEVSEILTRSRIVNVLWAVAGAGALATGIAAYATSREAGVSVSMKF
jgi:tetratricopeptide (TPR) repeat protein